jgi:hypothetical protein
MGNFQEGLPDGMCYAAFATGAEFMGRMARGAFIEGIQFEAETVYHGRFSEGMPHGYGFLSVREKF